MTRGNPAITATVTSDSNADLTSVLVRFRAVDGDALVTIGETRIDLDAGTSVETSIEWNDLTRVGSFEVRVIVDPRRADDVAAGIGRLLDPDRRGPMSEAALAVARQHSEEDNFRRVLRVFQAAAEESRGTV